MTGGGGHKREIITVGVLFFILIAGWSLFDNRVYFDVFDVQKADAATQTATLNASVGSSVTLTIESGATVQFGTLTAGTESKRMTSFNTDSNDTVNFSLGRDRAAPAHTLASTADPTNIFINDTAGGINVFDGVATCSATATWVSGSSTGLGFTIFAASENKDTSCFGTGITKTDAANKYAALQASASASTAWTSLTTGTERASLGWVLDVTGSQQATSYTGDVILTATATP